MAFLASNGLQLLTKEGELTGRDSKCSKAFFGLKYVVLAYMSIPSTQNIAEHFSPTP